jgi:outer membrane protein assembly factor BamA
VEHAYGDEFTIAPVAGGDTDIGIGVGFFSGLTRNRRGYDPFVWNLESAGLVSFVAPEGKVRIPYLDFYAKLTALRFLGGPLQLEVRPSFTDEQTLGYYGIGNASLASVPPGQSRRYFEYARVHPSLLVDLRFKIVDHFAGKIGARYTRSWLDIPAGSKLDEDLHMAQPEVRALLGSTEPQSVFLFRYGLQFDTRDNQITPHRGTFDEWEVRLSPGGAAGLPFRYGEASVNLRGYLPLSSQATFAVRAVGDVLYGDVPFYELSRFEDTYALGGSNGVRGVPAQRYYGKVKLFANAEVRMRLFDFRLFAKPMTLGFAAFVDGGRVWADTRPHPELDGSGLGIKYGVGGGLRLLSGTAFVLRGDVAWSPDALPIGGYVAAGEMF